MNKILTFGVLISALASGCQARRQASETTAPVVATAPTDSLPKAPPKPAPPPAAETSPLPAAVPYDAERAMVAAGLVNIQGVDSTIMVELKYSTTDNFVKADVYGDLTRAYLQAMPARKLAKAQQLLGRQRPGYRLLVYDAARPRRVQQVLWDTLKQYPPALRANYVANPREGSIHNYGSAVDLTVADSTGTPLDMGTPFDYFGPLAYPSQEVAMLRAGKLTPTQLANRHLLRTVMQQAGFSPITSEWWHFNALPLAQCKRTYKIVE